MDRTAWIVVVLCVVGLFLHMQTVSKRAAEGAPVPAKTLEPSGTDAGREPGTPAQPGEETKPVLKGADGRTPVKRIDPDTPEEKHPIVTQFADWEFTNYGAGVSSVTLLKHHAPDGAPVKLNTFNDVPIGALIENPSQPSLRPSRIVKKSDTEVVFESTVEDDVLVRKTYSLSKQEPGAMTGDDYLLRMKVDFINRNESKDCKLFHYFINVGSAQPLQKDEWSIHTRLSWYREWQSTHFKVDKFKGGGLAFWKHPIDYYLQQAKNLRWIGVRNQFFTTIFSVSPDASLESGQVWAERFPVQFGEETVPSAKSKHLGIHAAMGLPDILLGPGEEKSFSFEIYTGPKEYKRMVRLGNHRHEIMNYGLFAIISQFLMRSMVWLHGIVHNYGVAILILTLLIRSAMWPLQSKSNRAMKRMALLAPRISELKEKHKDDAQRMNQEVMKLYKHYRVNPLGGCLPLLVQIPIFFGFYQMLMSAVELRNQPFLWVSDLSMPDTVAHVGGFPLNILPLLMGATMIWQMMITPKTGDASQRRIFMFMPVVFLFICYGFAAALSLYWTTQNLFSIGQTYLTRGQRDEVIEDIKAHGDDKPKPKLKPRRGSSGGGAARSRKKKKR